MANSTCTAQHLTSMYSGPGYWPDLMGFVALQGAEAQQSFRSPEKAIEAFSNAVRAGDTARLLSILGPGSKDLVSSGDEVADQLLRTRFLKAYDEAWRIEKVGDTRAKLSIGHDDWSFPIPLVKKAARWRFNIQEGKEEILNRQIGQNESAPFKCVSPS